MSISFGFHLVLITVYQPLISIDIWVINIVYYKYQNLVNKLVGVILDSIY